MSATNVLCLGILVADVIGRPIDAYPPPGSLQLVPSITTHIGGCAANTGIGLQTLGIPTRVMGKVGRDGFGTFVRSELEAHGVDASALVEDRSIPTSATMVMVRSDAERTFLHCTGANATFTLDDFDMASLDGVSLLHIAGHGLLPRFDGEQCAQLLKQAREQGIRTCLDTAGAPEANWVEKLRLTLPHLDYFVPSLHEVAHLFPDLTTPDQIADQLLNEGVKTVALKMGERGSFVTNGNERFTVPPFHVEAVDATGAGDAFAAGFLCGLLNGLGLEQSALLGNATGALCVTQVGTIAGYRSLTQTLDFMRSESQSFL